MSLLTCQQKMIALISGTPNLDMSELSEAEKHWFSQLRADKGLEVTRDIIQWWRRTRLTYAMPFTMQYLKYIQLDHWVDNYIQQQPCRTLFFSQEGKQFYQFLSSQNSIPNRLLLSLAQFEMALREAHANASNKNSHAKTQTILFECDPKEFFAALLQNRLHDGIRHHPHEITISAQLPKLWRSVALED
jgi:hypothetical protein